MSGNLVNQEGYTPQWLIRLRSIQDQLGAAEQRVLEYLQQHQEEILNKSISDVAKAAEVSDATVVRLCRRLGYTGLKEFKIALAQEQTRPAEELDADLDWNDPLTDARRKIFRGGMTALMESSDLIDDEALGQATKLLARRSVHIYAGGGSAIIGAYLKRQLMKLGVRVELCDNIHAMRLSLAQLIREKDVAVCISCSGEEDSVLDSLRWAKSQGVPTIGITDRSHSSIGQEVNVLLHSTGGPPFMEDRHFFSRLAEMAVVNLLYVGTALELGPQAIDTVRLKGQEVMRMTDNG